MRSLEAYVWYIQSWLCWLPTSATELIFSLFVKGFHFIELLYTYRTCKYMYDFVQWSNQRKQDWDLIHRKSSDRGFRVVISLQLYNKGFYGTI